MTTKLSMLHALVLALALVFAVPAAAQTGKPQTTAPPGNSAIDEYLETVPSAGGNVRPSQGSKSAAPAAGLSPVRSKELEALGSEGKELARVVGDTAPAATAPGTTAAPVAAAPGKPPASAALAAGTGSDDASALGPLLGGFLLLTLLGILAVGVLRRRGSAP